MVEVSFSNSEAHVVVLYRGLILAGDIKDTTTFLACPSLLESVCPIAGVNMYFLSLYSNTDKYTTFIKEKISTSIGLYVCIDG